MRSSCRPRSTGSTSCAVADAPCARSWRWSPSLPPPSCSAGSRRGRRSASRRRLRAAASRTRPLAARGRDRDGEPRYAQVRGHSPALDRLAAGCGIASGYRAIAHPSLPNYIAMTSGDTQGISDDCSPSSGCSSAAPSIFSQVGSNWKAYAEAMPSPCYRDSSGDYSVRHNPATYYSQLSTCGANDVPRDALERRPARRPGGGDAAALRVRHARPVPRRARLLRLRATRGSEPSCGGSSPPGTTGQATRPSSSPTTRTTAPRTTAC